VTISLGEWVEKNGAAGLHGALEIHAEMGDPKDFARLAMISIRQWDEDRRGEPVIHALAALLQADPHCWSKRPCQTCSAASAMMGMKFGCVLYAEKGSVRP